MEKEARSCIFQRRPLTAVRLGIAVAVIFLSVFPLAAQVMVRQVSLAYLAQRADVIVQGRVSSVRHEPLPGYSNIPTVAVTLDVEKMIRGPEGGTYTFREILLGARPKEGKQSYRVGQRLLLFLPSPSRYGLSSPIGIQQGRFHISRDGRGKTTIINEFGNAGLFKNVEQALNRAGQKLTAAQLRTVAAERGPVPLDEFLSLVGRLKTLPRIQ
jgi:hypothetical protein